MAVTNKPRRMMVSDLGDNGDKAAQATFEPTNAVAEGAPKVSPAPSVQEEEPPRRAAKISVVRTVTSSDYEVVKATPKD